MKINIIHLLLLLLLASTAAFAQKPKGKLTSKPVFSDPIYDGAADPVIVWNKQEKKYFMFYTNRRAKATGLDGVTWVHGTRIGIAESKDGANWNYRDTANIIHIGHRMFWSTTVCTTCSSLTFPVFLPIGTIRARYYT
jgi:hypothetical protein